MKIALIGAPKTCKSETANLLSKGLSGSIAFIDDYVPEIEGETDMAMGYLATYIGNVRVALGRFERERLRASDVPKPDYLITCGTIVETIVYNSLQVYERKTHKALIETDQRRVEATTRFLSALYIDTWDYDFAFHLLPFDDTHDQLNRYIPEAIHLFEIPNCFSLEGSVEERADKALSYIGVKAPASQ